MLVHAPVHGQQRPALGIAGLFGVQATPLDQAAPFAHEVSLAAQHHEAGAAAREVELAQQATGGGELLAEAVAAEPGGALAGEVVLVVAVLQTGGKDGGVVAHGERDDTAFDVAVGRVADGAGFHFQPGAPALGEHEVDAEGMEQASLTIAGGAPGFFVQADAVVELAARADQQSAEAPAVELVRVLRFHQVPHSALARYRIDQRRTPDVARAFVQGGFVLLQQQPVGLGQQLAQ